MSSPYRVRSPQKTASYLTVPVDAGVNSFVFTSPGHRGSTGLLGWQLAGHSTPKFRSPKTPGFRTPMQNTPNRLGLTNPTLSPNDDGCVFVTPSSHPRITDRYIPNRSFLDVDISHHALLHSTNPSSSLSPSPARVLPFTARKQSKELSPENCHKRQRKVNRLPERIMSAPAVVRDAPQTIAWGPSSMMAVALGDGVYVCDSGRDYAVTQLTQIRHCWSYASLAWNPGFSPQLLAASNDCALQIWDVNAHKLSHTYFKPDVTLMAWHEKVLAGSAGDNVSIFDPLNFELAGSFRTSSSITALCVNSSGQKLICGHDNGNISVWDYRACSRPLCNFNAHGQSAVRALAWCPFSNSFASGSAAPTPAIHFWSGLHGEHAASPKLPALSNGKSSISEVSALVWNAEYKELASAHGKPNPGIILWDTLSQEPVAKFTEHSEKVTGMVANNERTTLASMGEDELAILWKCWPHKSKKKTNEPSSALTLSHIR